MDWMRKKKKTYLTIQSYLMINLSPHNLIQSYSSRFSFLKESILHLLFPHLCAGCGTDTITIEHYLCAQCVSALPQTAFEKHAHNPLEKIFWGRLPLVAATARYYFTKHSQLQELMHQFKYRERKELGFYLGRLLGSAIASTDRFNDVDVLVPLPLFVDKERQRGYNQSMVLCEGIADVWLRPILDNAVARIYATESQTKKNRVERWQNMQDRFQLLDPAAVANKHILLIDDVITTGATLEACGRVLLNGQNTRLSIATLCISAS
jgi:ComF family protein